jgi:hypothetical protein
VDTVSSNKTNFVNLANKIHNRKYDYSLCNYINSYTKVEIVCCLHGSFWQKPIKHTYRKNGCPKCNGINKLTKDKFIKKAILIHNKLYDYSKVSYINSHSKVEIICKQHGSFWQTPTNHLSGQKCPYCLITKGETYIKQYLENKRYPFVFQWIDHNCLSPKGNKLKFDFYLPEHNTCIEFDGIFHYQDVYKGCGHNLVKIHDEIKNEWCKRNDIKLIRISKMNDNAKLECIDQLYIDKD